MKFEKAWKVMRMCQKSKLQKKLAPHIFFLLSDSHLVHFTNRTCTCTHTHTGIEWSFSISFYDTKRRVCYKKQYCRAICICVIAEKLDWRNHIFDNINFYCISSQLQQTTSFWNELLNNQAYSKFYFFCPLLSEHHLRFSLSS